MQGTRDAVDPRATGRHITRGRTLPRSVAPAGAQLVVRFRVDNWVIARFELTRPMRASIDATAWQIASSLT